MTLLRPLLVVAFLFFGCLRAQVVWERIGSGAQFVSAHVLFDDQNGRFLAVDSWPPQILEWNGAAWQTIATVPYSLQSGYPRATYDVARHRVVMVGLRVNGFLGNCIVEWDGASWFLFNPPGFTNPSSWYGSVIWDPVRQKTIVADVRCREWNGTTLTDLGPLPSSPYGLCFNAISGRPLLPSNPAYELLATNVWSATPPMSPGVQMNFAFHDPVSNTIQTIPVQGWSYLPEVWNGTAWYPVNVGSVSNYGWQNIAAVGTNPTTHEILGISQQGTYRVLRGPRGSLTAFGASCPGAAGTPAVIAASSPWTTPVPVVGETIVFDATNLAPYPYGIRYFILGFSNTMWGTTPVPLDLSAFGWSGCFLNQSFDHMEAPISGGMTIDVPAMAGLVGFTFYVQAMGLELVGAGGGPGVAMSRSVAATIGVWW